MIVVRSQLRAPQITSFNLFGHGAHDTGTTFTDIEDTPMVDLNPVPANLNIETVAAQLTAALGGDVTLTPEVGGVSAGSPLTIPGGQTGARATVGYAVEQPLLFTELQGKKAQLILSGTTATAMRLMARYILDSPRERFSIITSGFSSTPNLGDIGNPVFYQGFGSNDARIVESQVQLPWPNIDGVFQYFMAVGIVRNPTGGPVYRAQLRVGGTTAIELTSSPVVNSPFFLFDDTIQAACRPSQSSNMGPLVNFATEADGPLDGDNQVRMFYAIGFLPD